MVNITSVDKIFRASMKIPDIVMNTLHDILEKNDGINYIVYGSIQALDQYIISQFPGLKVAYPEKSVNLTLYLSGSQEEKHLGVPEELIDTLIVTSGNLLYYALKSADIVLAYSQDEFYHEAKQVLFNRGFQGWEYDGPDALHYSLMIISDEEEQRIIDRPIHCLPKTEKDFVDAICNPTLSKVDLKKENLRYYEVYESVNAMLTLQRNGFCLYDLLHGKKNNKAERVLLMQSDELCDRPLGDVLYTALEKVIKENEVVDIVFFPCLGTIQDESLEMLEKLKDSYSTCKISVIGVVDAQDIKRYKYLQEKQGSLKEFLFENAISIPENKLDSIIYFPYPSAYVHNADGSRTILDKMHRETLQFLFRYCDQAFIYHYDNYLDDILRIMRKLNEKKNSIPITHLCNSEVYSAVQSVIEGFAEDDKIVYTMFCEGKKATDIERETGIKSKSVNSIVTRLAKDIQDRLFTASAAN